MYEFMCAHEECRSEIIETDRDGLRQRVAEHLKKAYNIDKPNETLMTYLEVASMTAPHNSW